MEVSIQEKEYCKIQANYTADSDVVFHKRQEALKQLKGVAIPGFRVNKVPDFAIRKYIERNKNVKNQIENWVKQELVQQALDDIIFETKIKTIGKPELVALNLTETGFSCEISLMKKPDFVLKEYKSLEIPKPQIPSTQTELVETMLQELRNQNGDIVPYSDVDFVQTGDQITMDFEISVNDQIIEGGKVEGQLYIVGDHSVFPEFDSNLLGMVAGETREFDVILPDNFLTQAGKEAHVKAIVHMGTKKNPMPLNDELAQKLGLKDYEELRFRVEGIATQKIQSTEMALLSQQVIKRLVSDHEFEVPSWLTNMEAQFLAAQEQIKWAEVNDDVKNSYLKRATENVKLSLIIDSIQEQEPETVLSDSEIINMIKERVQSMGNDPENFLVESQKNGQLLGIVASLRNEFTLQWIIKQSKIIE